MIPFCSVWHKEANAPECTVPPCAAYERAQLGHVLHAGTPQVLINQLVGALVAYGLAGLRNEPKAILAWIGIVGLQCLVSNQFLITCIWLTATAVRLVASVVLQQEPHCSRPAAGCSVGCSTCCQTAVARAMRASAAQPLPESMAEHPAKLTCCLAPLDMDCRAARPTPSACAMLLSGARLETAAAWPCACECRHLPDQTSCCCRTQGTQ